MVQDILIEISKSLAVMSTELQEIKEDLRHHIKRTELLEQEVTRLRETDIRMQAKLKGAMLVLGALGSIGIAALKFLK